MRIWQLYYSVVFNSSVFMLKSRNYSLTSPLFEPLERLIGGRQQQLKD